MLYTKIKNSSYTISTAISTKTSKVTSVQNFRGYMGKHTHTWRLSCFWGKNKQTTKTEHVRIEKYKYFIYPSGAP